MFLDLPARIYANDPHWVPPLRSSFAKHLLPVIPSFRQVTTVYLIPGGKGSQAVGRIVAAINERLITRGENVGLVGFECVPDFDVLKPC